MYFTNKYTRKQMKNIKLLSGLKVIFVFTFAIISMNANAQQINGLGIFDGTSNIGGMKMFGSISYDASTQTYTLSGAGDNVWGNTDQHFYAWKKISGDFTMTTKVTFVGDRTNHRKIGIMIRDALTGESRCAHISFHGDGLTSLQSRTEPGGPTGEIKGPANGNYMTLEKIGNKIRMKTATGVLPREVTAEIEMEFSGFFYVGFFICSHDVDVLETAYFTNVEFKKL